MNSKSSSEKKRVAHIGNLANTCLEGESELPPDDYVYSILENMNATLNNSEKKVVSYQQLQDFRSVKGRTMPDIDSEQNNSSSNGQNDSSYLMKQRKKILPPKVYPLMAKCQRNLKYLKHNRCIPKQRAHLGFDLEQKKVLISPKRPLKISYLNNISKKVNKDKSTKLNSKKSKISTEKEHEVSSNSNNNELEKISPSIKKSDLLFEDEFETESSNTISNKVKKKLKSKKHKKSNKESSDFESNSSKNIEKNTPSRKESDMESDDDFENFIRKHNPPKKKKRIIDFSSDFSDDSISHKKKKVKKLKKGISRKQDKEATTSTEVNASTLKAMNSSKHKTKSKNKLKDIAKKTKLKNKTKDIAPTDLSEETKTSSVELQEDVCNSVEGWTDDSVNDFDAFCHDDSSDSLGLHINDSNTANIETAVITNDSKFSQLFENNKEISFPETNSELLQANSTNVCDLESQNIGNKNLLPTQVPCSVMLKRLSASKNSTNLMKSCEATENSPKKINELNLNEKSSVKSCSPIQTEFKKTDIRSESDDDCVVLDDPKENDSFQKSESIQESLKENIQLLNTSLECNNSSVSNSLNKDVSVQCSSGEFNVKILSVRSLGESNSITDSPDNIKKPLNINTTEPAIKLEDSDIEIIDLEIPQAPPKDNALLLRKAQGSMLCDQAIKVSKNDVLTTKDNMFPLQSTRSPTNDNNNAVLNSTCDSVTLLNKFQRNAEQSNVQVLKDSPEKSNKIFNQDPKLNESSVVEKYNVNVLGKHSSLMSDCIIIEDESLLPSNLIENNSSKSSKICSASISDKSITVEPKSAAPSKSSDMTDDTSSKTTSFTMSDDCIVIDDECPLTVSTEQSTDISTKDNADSSSKNLNELRPFKNVNTPNVMHMSSLSKNTSSMIPDDCIIIDDDESPLTPGTKQDISAKGNYECSSNEISVQLQSVENVCKLKLVTDNTMQKSSSSRISDECIIIDDEIESSTFSDKIQSAGTSQATRNGSSIVAEDENKSGINLKNSVQNASSIKNTKKPLYNCNDSSRFKPDSVPNEQVLSLLKTIDFESIKNILNGINQESSADCDKNNSVSCEINNSSKVSCQVNKNLNDEVVKSINVSETVSKCHKDSVLLKSIDNFTCVKETSVNNPSSSSSNLRSCDSPEIIEENNGNLASNFTFSKSNFVPIINSSPVDAKSKCVKIEKDCSFVEASDISSTLKNDINEIKLKRKSTELSSVERSDTSKTNVYKKRKCDSLKPIDIQPELQNAHNYKPLPETLKQEVTFESTSDELDIIATSSIETLNDDKQTSILPLMDLYKEEFKKYQEIQCTGRNLSAGLNLLHKKQLEKLMHIQTSIKNILKHDPCFHKIVKEEKNCNKVIQKVEPVCQKNSLQVSKQSYSYTKNLPLPTNAQVVFKPSQSAGSTSRNEKVYQHTRNVTCAHCAKPAIAACQGCFKVYYCSTECGLIAWNKGHSVTCGT